jgi:hypothetical protein
MTNIGTEGEDGGSDSEYDEISGSDSEHSQMMMRRLMMPMRFLDKRRSWSHLYICQRKRYYIYVSVINSHRQSLYFQHLHERVY